MTVGIWTPPDLPDPIRTCLSPNPNLPSERVFFGECSKPVWDHPTNLIGLLWEPQRLVFHIPIKGTPLTICTTFIQPLELSTTSLCEIQVFGERFLSWVESFVCEHLSSSLEHFGLHQALVKCLLLLEVKLPRWLGVALELRSMWWVLGKFVKVGFTFERNKAS
jgi:hypothetical protein